MVHHKGVQPVWNLKSVHCIEMIQPSILLWVQVTNFLGELHRWCMFRVPACSCACMHSFACAVMYMCSFVSVWEREGERERTREADSDADCRHFLINQPWWDRHLVNWITSNTCAKSNAHHPLFLALISWISKKFTLILFTSLSPTWTYFTCQGSFELSCGWSWLLFIYGFVQFKLKYIKNTI